MQAYVYSTVIALLAIFILALGFTIWPEYIMAYLLICAVLVAVYPIDVTGTESWYLRYTILFLVFITAPMWFFVALKDN